MIECNQAVALQCYDAVRMVSVEQVLAADRTGAASSADL